MLRLGAALAWMATAFGTHPRQYQAPRRRQCAITVQLRFMSARAIIFLVSLVLLWTGFPTLEQSASGARAAVELVDVTGKADLRWDVHDSSVNDHHLDEQPAQPHAESGADLSELIPVRYRGVAPSRRMGWEGSRAVRARVPPCLDGPQRPPDATRIVA